MPRRPSHFLARGGESGATLSRCFAAPRRRRQRRRRGWHRSGGPRPWLLDLADELRQDATLWPAAAGLTVAALDWGSAEETAGALLRLVAEASVEPLFMRRLAAEVEATMGRDRTLWEPAAAVSLLDRLDRVQDVAARLVEISIVKAAARRAGWVEPWAGRLRKLRRHENVGVRTTALEVRTSHGVGNEDGFAGCGLRFPRRGGRRLIW